MSNENDRLLQVETEYSGLYIDWDDYGKGLDVSVNLYLNRDGYEEDFFIDKDQTRKLYEFLKGKFEKGGGPC